MSGSITDTQWLIQAISSELSSLGVLDQIVPWSGQQFDDAWENLRAYPDSVAFVIPQGLVFEHSITSGIIISTDKIRSVTLIISMGKPGKINGDWVSLAGAIDTICDHLDLCKFGMRGDVMCMVSRADPIDVYYDDAPGRAAWRVELQVRRAV